MFAPMEEVDLTGQAGLTLIRDISGSTLKRYADEELALHFSSTTVPFDTQNLIVLSRPFFAGECLKVQYQFNFGLRIENGIIGVEVNFGKSPEHPDLKHCEALVSLGLNDSLGRSIGNYETTQFVNIADSPRISWNTNIPVNGLYGIKDQIGDNKVDDRLFRIVGRIRAVTFFSEENKSIEHPIARPKPVVSTFNNMPENLKSVANTGPKINCFNDQLWYEDGKDVDTKCTELNLVGSTSAEGANEFPTFGYIWTHKQI